METPAVEVIKRADAHDANLANRIAEGDILDPKTKKILAKDNEYIGKDGAKAIQKAYKK